MCLDAAVLLVSYWSLAWGWSCGSGWVLLGLLVLGFGERGSTGSEREAASIGERGRLMYNEYWIGMESTARMTKGHGLDQLLVSRQACIRITDWLRVDCRMQESIQSRTSAADSIIYISGPSYRSSAHRYIYTAPAWRHRLRKPVAPAMRPRTPSQSLLKAPDSRL